MMFVLLSGESGVQVCGCGEQQKSSVGTRPLLRYSVQLADRVRHHFTFLSSLYLSFKFVLLSIGLFGTWTIVDLVVSEGIVIATFQVILSSQHSLYKLYDG